MSVLQLDDPALLRVTWVADVLHNCGQLLASQPATAETYELSSQAENIQVFISHNWAFERKRKFLALALNFNLNMATGLAMASLVPGAGLTYIAAKRNWFAIPIEQMPITSTTTMLTFFIVLLFGHEGQTILGLKGKSVFLDKACIHQVDPSLKARGILSLGTFLYKSESLFVCYTEMYLKRLWTVYEFAAFLLVHRQTSGLVHVMPARLPVFVLASSFCAFCGVVADHAVVAVGYHTPVLGIIGKVAVAGILVGMARWWAQHQNEACAIFKDFALERTYCVSELDRALVRSNIIALMRHFGHVDAHAPDKEAIAAFDEFVRSSSSRAFVTSVGRLGIQYKLLLPILLVVFSNAMALWSAAVGAGYWCHQNAAQIIFMLMAHISGSFAVLPLAAAILLHLTKYFPRLRGAAQVVYCGAVALAAFAVAVVLEPLDGPLRPWLLDPALESERSCLGFVLYCVALFAMTALAYRQPQRQVDAPAARPRIAGSGLEVVDSAVGAAVEAACKVGAPALSPGQPEVTEHGTGWELEVAVIKSGDSKVAGHLAERCSVPPTMRRIVNNIEASGMVVEM